MLHAADAPESFLYSCLLGSIYILRLSRNGCASCTFALKYILFFPKKFSLTKTTSKYFAGLQDPFKDKYINGKSNYKLQGWIQDLSEGGGKNF